MYCSICENSKMLRHNIQGLLKCSSCHYTVADLSLNDSELRRLYSSKYFKGEEYGDYLGDRKVIEVNFKSKLKKILKYIEKPQNKSIFEIGCAYGFFLNLAKKHFKSLQGIDIDEDVTRYGRENFQLDIDNSPFLNIDFKEKIDVFCLWAVIAHLPSPDEYIKKISSNLNKGGILALTTGDIQSLNARIRGINWRLIHPPTHLNYYSKNSIEKLLNKYGLEIVHFSHPGSWMSLNHILHSILVIKFGQTGLYNFLAKLGLTKMIVFVNMLDVMFVIARKVK